MLVVPTGHPESQAAKNANKRSRDWTQLSFVKKDVSRTAVSPNGMRDGLSGAGRSRPSHSRIQLLSACGASACAFQAPHAAALPNSPAKLSDRCCWRIHAAKCARSAETEAELTTNRRATRRDAISEPAVQSSGTYARMRSRLRIADLNRRAPSCSER